MVPPICGLRLRVFAGLVCAAIALQSAAVVEAPHAAVRQGSALYETADEASHRAALKKAEGQAVIAALRGACVQRTPRRYEAARPVSVSAVRRATAWRYGAAFARTYVPHRLRELFAPPSTNDPDA